MTPLGRPAGSTSSSTHPQSRRTPLTVHLARAAGIGGLVALVAFNLYGWSYYLAPAAMRVRHPLHAWLKPSGTIGQSLGFLAMGLFLFLWLYPLRKRFSRRLEATGSIGSWLDVHIVAGLLVPLVAATHASWRFRGLIGLGYLSLLVVFLSGLIGRYLYAHVPRSRNGLEMTLEEASAERRSLLQQIARAAGLPVTTLEQKMAPASSPGAGRGILRVVLGMIGDDLARMRRLRDLRRLLAERAAGGLRLSRKTRRELVRLMRREIALGQQIRMLDGIHRVFRYWHAAHKPFAVTALGAVLLHVIVVVAVGSTWLW